MSTMTKSALGANPERWRGHNRQVVLGCVRTAGPIGRADIAKSSGLSTQAVSNIMADLLEDGLIVEDGRRAGARGLPAMLYALNPKGGYALGLEIRPDAILGTLLNLRGETVAETRQPIATAHKGAVLSMSRRATRALCNKTGISHDQLIGAGIVMPGPFGETGLRGAASELPDFGAPPEAWLSEGLDLPVLIENDANAAAMAEATTGVAQHLKTFAFLYFGAGLGLAIVQDGKLVKGAFGNAGEIGHIPVPRGGEAAPLEDLVSRFSLQNHLGTVGIDVRSSEDLADLFARREPVLMEWLASASEPLSHAIHIIENMLDPEAIVLGGAMPFAILEELAQRVRLSPQSLAQRGQPRSQRLLLGSGGRMTATRGAAALVLSQVFTPKIAAQA